MTPPPLFPMENKTNKPSDAYDYVRRIVMPIFNKVPKEAPKNRLSVGSVRPSYCLYNPHNYRLYVDFHISEVTKTQLYKDRPRFLGHSYKVMNRTEIFFPHFLDCTLTVKKSQICIRHKENIWYRILLTKNPEDQIINICRKKDAECLKALKEFINLYGGKSEYRILNRHAEDKVKHEDFIDTIPIKQKFHNKILKKVYNEPNIEFSDPAFTSNYLTNKSIESIAPEIARSIDALNPLRALKQKIKRPEDALKYPDLVGLLTPLEKGQLSSWFFTL